MRLDSDVWPTLFHAASSLATQRPCRWLTGTVKDGLKAIAVTLRTQAAWNTIPELPAICLGLPLRICFGQRVACLWPKG